MVTKTNPQRARVVGCNGMDPLGEYIQQVELGPLLMTVAHLTGNPDVLRPGWVPPPPSLVTGQSPPGPDDDRARALCLRWLREFRASRSRLPTAPDQATIAATLRWAIDADNADLTAMCAEEFSLPGQDHRAPRWHHTARPDVDLNVVIVGAGLSGILTGYRLRQAGIPFTIYEKNHEVGGTWLENSYPGCRVDAANALFSFSFAPKFNWTHRFPLRDSILEYLRCFASEEGLYEHVRFGCEVRAAQWSEADHRWTVSVQQPGGFHRTSAAVLVCAVGQLNKPKSPDLDGLATFSGPAFHSARWNHDVSFTGRHVGVIGTGASAHQLVPELAPRVRALTIFMRTPPWLVSTPGYRALVAPAEQWFCEQVPYFGHWRRLWLFMQGIVGHADAEIMDPALPPSERSVSPANEAMRAALTAAAQRQTHDRPDLSGHVVPAYPPGAKRMCRDDGSWIAALRRENVHVVRTPIREVTPAGLRTDDGMEHALDVLVFATGFKASMFLNSITVTGRRGRDLHRFWGDDARAYLGLTVAGFPNLFCLYGPNTNLVLHGASTIHMAELQVNYLMECLGLLIQAGHRSMEVREEVYLKHNRAVDQANAERVWVFSNTHSWFNNSNGRTAQNWPFSVLEYWQRTHRVRSADYLLT